MILHSKKFLPAVKTYKLIFFLSVESWNFNRESGFCETFFLLKQTQTLLELLSFFREEKLIHNFITTSDGSRNEDDGLQT